LDENNYVPTETTFIPITATQSSTDGNNEAKFAIDENTENKA